jgi:NADPH:quinone reductase-like Zn-dependent oxidoreductase
MRSLTKSIAAVLVTSSLACLDVTAGAGSTAIPATTRQVVLAKDASGHYAWNVVQAAVPAVGDHQVLVHVHAVSLQRGELELLDSLNKPTDKARDRSGQIVCSDAAGEVVAVGKKVTTVRTGAQVTSLYFADFLDGTLTAEKLARARALGAQEGINYKTVPAWSERVRELTGGRGADLVIDIGGKATMEQSLKSVAYGGTIALVGGLGGYTAEIPEIELIRKVVRAQGVYAGSRADYLRMTQFFEAHRLHPLVERTYSLDNYQAALDDLAANNFMGKLVIRL